jgi:Domain of unknown function (DUF4105)
MSRAVKGVGLALLTLVLIALSAWGVLAIYYSNLSSGLLRTALAAVFGVLGVLTVYAFVLGPWRWPAACAFLGIFLAVVAWWTTIEPSNDRDWRPEVARLPYATQDGNRITLHHIRDFEYRSETDFTPRYYDKTFDLDQLDSVDLLASYWMGPGIAHTFVSFGFGGRDYVAMSAETRTERSEGYSSIKGFFKQYELIYVVGDERDLIGLRTTYRTDPPEDVYLYRVRAPIENLRHFFMDYIRQINALAERPAFYNTLTTNCTTNLLLHTRVNPGHLRYSWKVLLSGYFPEYAYEEGRLDTNLPFAELRKRSRINAVAEAADAAPDFSQRIRADLPNPTTVRVEDGRAE